MGNRYKDIAGEERFFFVLPLLDVYDRMVVEFHKGLSCESQDAIRTIKRSLLRRQLHDKDIKPIIRSDNGPQFIANKFEEVCHKLKIEHERIPPKTPNLNAHIKSFHRLLEEARGRMFKPRIKFL